MYPLTKPLPLNPEQQRAAAVIARRQPEGGVGKTTTTANLAKALADLGRRVLAVDLDPQASLTIYFSRRTRARSMPKAAPRTRLCSKGGRSRRARPRGSPALLPASIRLASGESDLLREWNGATLLAGQLARRRAGFDVVLIDCSPSLGLLHGQRARRREPRARPGPDRLSPLMGVSLLFETIEKIRTRLNPELAVLGVLPTMHDARNSHDREALAELAELLAGRCRLFPPVRRSTAFDQASVAGVPGLDYPSLKRAVEGYQALARTLLEELGR